MATVTVFRQPTTVTILSGATVSQEVDLTAEGSRHFVGLMLTAPGTLPETVTVQTATKVGGVYGNFQSAGVDVTIGAGKSVQITDLVAGGLKLVAGGAVAADRVFQIVGALRLKSMLP
jgi:hypothetical protein